MLSAFRRLTIATSRNTNLLSIQLARVCTTLCKPFSIIQTIQSQQIASMSTTTIETNLKLSKNPYLFSQSRSISTKVRKNPKWIRMHLEEGQLIEFHSNNSTDLAELIKIIDPPDVETGKRRLLVRRATAEDQVILERAVRFVFPIETDICSLSDVKLLKVYEDKIDAKFGGLDRIRLIWNKLFQSNAEKSTKSDQIIINAHTLMKFVLPKPNQKPVILHPTSKSTALQTSNANSQSINTRVPEAHEFVYDEKSSHFYPLLFAFHRMLNRYPTFFEHHAGNQFVCRPRSVVDNIVRLNKKKQEQGLTLFD